MRMTLAAPALLLALALSACGVPLGSEVPDQFDATCAEQSALATQGRTDGREITIVCP